MVQQSVMKLLDKCACAHTYYIPGTKFLNIRIYIRGICTLCVVHTHNLHVYSWYFCSISTRYCRLMTLFHSSLTKTRRKKMKIYVDIMLRSHSFSYFVCAHFDDDNTLNHTCLLLHLRIHCNEQYHRWNIICLVLLLLLLMLILCVQLICLSQRLSNFSL